MAVGLFAAILKIHRQKSVKMVLNLDQISKMNGIEGRPVTSADQWPSKWGFREDNAWLTYRNNLLPKTAEEWDNCLFVEKTHNGFYCWPEY